MIFFGEISSFATEKDFIESKLDEIDRKSKTRLSQEKCEGRNPITSIKHETRLSGINSTLQFGVILL
jgi:hypothetical protein